ncbi:MAG: class I SAM-dependent methyltransferase [Candidatus Thiodiazotropha sp. (ex Epidulcina cf. delphinae)]|nr:class I SAM-dependent methyltransferase [Candidatus Thiodiazotropha sp. (ex Epidulcina cf. delphinae)]
MEEYESLQAQLELNDGIPYTPDWSAGGDFIQIIVDACLSARPSLVLECSSGLTTLMLARCCQMNGRGRVVSLEDGEQYADNTRAYIDRYGLGRYASVIHAPLRRSMLDGAEYAWYAIDKIPEKGIDMLVIDGPSGFIQKHSRYPALPVCYSRLSEGCRIYLDDAARPDEREIVALWQARYPTVRHEYRETSRGCSILTVEYPG